MSSRDWGGHNNRHLLIYLLIHHSKSLLLLLHRAHTARVGTVCVPFGTRRVVCRNNGVDTRWASIGGRAPGRAVNRQSELSECRHLLTWHTATYRMSSAASACAERPETASTSSATWRRPARHDDVSTTSQWRHELPFHRHVV